MTPREKAKELRTLFAQELIDLTDNEDLLNSRIKNCALIVVGEMLEILYESPAKNIKEIAFCIDVTNELKKL